MLVVAYQNDSEKSPAIYTLTSQMVCDWMVSCVAFSEWLICMGQSWSDSTSCFPQSPFSMSDHSRTWTLYLNRGRRVLQGTGGVSTAFASGQRYAWHHRRADLKGGNEACGGVFKNPERLKEVWRKCRNISVFKPCVKQFFWVPPQWPIRMKCRGGMSN